MKFSKNSKKQIYFIVIPLFFLISCGSKKQEAVNVETPIINLVKLSDVQTKNAGIIIAKMEQKEWDEDSNNTEEVTVVATGDTGWYAISSYSSSSTSSYTVMPSGVMINSGVNMFSEIRMYTPDISPIRKTLNILSWIKRLWSKYIRGYDE